MDNENIKEIINDLQRVADRKCYPEDILDGSVAQEWVDYIEDYITNLQESEAYYYGQYKDYKTRCEKAIEILKDTNVNMPETLLIETIDYARHILNGGDNNE